MPQVLADVYLYEDTSQQIDKYLHIETAMLRVQLAETEALRKLIHHFKLVNSQVGKILDGVPTYVTNSDGSLTTLIEKDDLDLLKKMTKQLDVFELPNITPELERDIFVYTFAHNFSNKYAQVYKRAYRSYATKLFAAELGVRSGGILALQYWKYVESATAVNLIDEPGYTWEFIDPNDEVTKISDEDNITEYQARSKIMQRVIDGLYDDEIISGTEIMEEFSPDGIAFLDLFENYNYTDKGQDYVKNYDEAFATALRKYDPSRFPTDSA